MEDQRLWFVVVLGCFQLQSVIASVVVVTTTITVTTAAVCDCSIIKHPIYCLSPPLLNTSTHLTFSLLPQKPSCARLSEQLKRLSPPLSATSLSLVDLLPPLAFSLHLT